MFFNYFRDSLKLSFKLYFSILGKYIHSLVAYIIIYKKVHVEISYRATCRLDFPVMPVIAKNKTFIYYILSVIRSFVDNSRLWNGIANFFAKNDPTPLFIRVYGDYSIYS